MSTKVDLVKDFVLDEVSVDDFLSNLDDVFKYDNPSNHTVDSGISSPNLAKMPHWYAAPVTKTPVSMLQEYCAKRNVTSIPQYEEINFAWMTSGHKFGYTVSTTYAGETKTSKGYADNKKDAKQEAARNLYELLTERKLPGSAASSPFKTSAAPISHINRLQEIAVRDGYALPKYINERGTGPPHKREFQVDCVWRDQRTTGLAATKKLAKMDAAQKMNSIFA